LAAPLSSLEVHNDPAETQSITLHAASNLNVHAAVLASTAGQIDSSVTAENIRCDKKLERLTIAFPKDTVKLASGHKYRLDLCFDSELDSSMMGYYKSTYSLPDGSTGYYALTQFEPTAARRAFPCFDEPDIKATFSVTLLSRRGLTVLGNLPVEGTGTDIDTNKFLNILAEQSDKDGSARQGQENDRWVATTFQTSPKMSTYLVAWANGDFQSLESSFTSPLTGKQVPLKVYTTPEHIHQARAVLDVKARVLPIYEKMFDIEYPLPKLDTLVANDFEAGAMENWGLITGATDMYLLDEENASIDSRKMLTVVQSHGGLCKGFS
jgi:aminopeptidase 2